MAAPPLRSYLAKWRILTASSLAAPIALLAPSPRPWLQGCTIREPRQRPPRAREEVVPAATPGSRDGPRSRGPRPARDRDPGLPPARGPVRYRPPPWR